MRALMFMPLPVQGTHPILVCNDTSTDDWNARSRMDAPPNWLSSKWLMEEEPADDDVDEDNIL